MRTLRFVGTAGSDRVLLETEDGSDQFELAVTAELRAAAAHSDAPHLPFPPIGAALRPRDIQVRVRAGADPAQLAEESGLSIENVLRFAAPVLDERGRVASEARRARARRNGDGPLAVFGETVDARFGARGIDPAAVSWDAHRRSDGQWTICARWRESGLERRADWSFSLAGRIVTALDEAGAEMLSDRPVRPAPVPPPFVPQLVIGGGDEDAPEPAAAAARSAFETADTDVMPELPLSIADTTAAAEAGAGELAPAEPVSPVEPAVRKSRGSSRSRRGSADARPAVPSWDDILLGVRRAGD